MGQDWRTTHIYFLGLKMNFLQFAILFIIWFFLLTFVWPIFLGSYFFVLTFLAAVPAILAGLIFKNILGFLLLLHWLNKKVVGIIHVVLLMLFTLIVTWAYSWFEPMEPLSFLNLFVTLLFSSYLISRFITETTKWNDGL